MQMAHENVSHIESYCMCTFWVGQAFGPHLHDKLAQKKRRKEKQLLEYNKFGYKIQRFLNFTFH